MNALIMQVFNDSLMPKCVPRSVAGTATSLSRQMIALAKYIVAGALSVIWIAIATAASAGASGRVALLLTAEKYQNFKASRISAVRSEELAQALRSQGFDVTVATNPSNAAARAALTEFAGKTESADFALIVAAGHFATLRGRSFYLPSNVRVRRATDLFSRGVAAVSLVNLAGQAKSGAVAMITTVAGIPSTVVGVSARPAFSGKVPDNVVVVFSSSPKVPVSGVDNVSVQAMKALIGAAGKTPLTLAALVDGASAGGTGMVFGTIKEINLSDSAAPAMPAPSPDTVAADANAEAAAAREAARKADELAQAKAKAKAVAAAASSAARRAEELAKAKQRAEARAGEAEKRAKLAEQRAHEAEARAKRELAAARAAQKAALAAARKARRTGVNSWSTARPARRADDIKSLQVVEALLGREQRKTIQRILKRKGLYDGPIDAIFGEGTRLAIKAFQKQSGATETGYMTPEQFQQLVAKQQ